MRQAFLGSLIVGACVLLPGCASIPGCQPPAIANGASIEAIRTVLDTQSAAWNRGDLDGFMQGYWHSDTLRFAGGDGATYGWQATLDRYRRRYPDTAAMGQLSFTDLDIEVLATDAAVVFGHWSLQRVADRPHGVFTLVFRKFDDGWKITRDHSS